MVAAVGFFTLMDAIAKYLSRWYPMPRDRLGALRAKPDRSFSRGSRYAANCDASGPRGPESSSRAAFCWQRRRLIYFTSLTVLPLADAAAIAFVLPLFVAALAVPMLGERLDRRTAGSDHRRTRRARCWSCGPGSVGLHPVRAAADGDGVLQRAIRSSRRKVAGVEHPLTSLIWGAIVGAALLARWCCRSRGRLRTALRTGRCSVVIGMLASSRTLPADSRIRLRVRRACSRRLRISGLLWAMALGFLVFGNFPDGWALGGMSGHRRLRPFIVSRQRLTVHRG